MYVTIHLQKGHHVFIVTGSTGGIPYDVTVDQGRVTGSERIAGLLSVHSGETFSMTPTGEGYPLDVIQSPISVLAALHSLTEVTEVTGDAPTDAVDDDVPADAKFSE